MLVYDLEIIKAIPPKSGQFLGGIEYCENWQDTANMGISVIGTYDYLTNQYQIFLEDNFDEFVALARSHSTLVGFNNIKFDNAVLIDSGLSMPRSGYYDLLVEIWAGAGLESEFQYPSHAGYGLDAVCSANGLGGKTGRGDLAPVLWQQGKYGQVINYCLNDVLLTKRLLDLVLKAGRIKSPKTMDFISVKRP